MSLTDKTGVEKASSPRWVVARLVRLYQWVISPLLPGQCRFTPSCSQYAMEAIEKYGVFKGSLLGLWRLLRCHPFCEGGFDPVKENG